MDADNSNSIQLVFDGFHLLTFDPTVDDQWGLIEDGAICVSGDTIAWVGKSAQLNQEVQARIAQGKIDCVKGEGAFLSPGLIDCHTHLVFGGSRADEWQMRLQGRSYQEIARAGGGIRSTVGATRDVGESELLELALPRARNLMRQGVTTIEVKSGYGLTLQDERKMLNVANRLGDELPITVHPTLLAAHAVPEEFAGRPDDYIDLVVREIVPACKDIATAVDVFTENIGFNLEQTRRVFEAAAKVGLDIKVHAEQLSNLGGAKLASEMGALSADHIEYLDKAGVEAMANSQTVATLLPGAFYFIKETQKPPVDLLREHKVPIAIASDLNPGSSPVANILLVPNMACTFFGLTPCEAIRGLTFNAARALGVHDRVGSLSKGKQADLAIWNVSSPAELAYIIGHEPCRAVYQAGQELQV